MIEHPFLSSAFLATLAPSCAQASFLGEEVGVGTKGYWRGRVEQ